MTTYDGPTDRELFHMPAALQETLLLLTSTFTCALAMFRYIKATKGRQYSGF